MADRSVKSKVLDATIIVSLLALASIFINVGYMAYLDRDCESFANNHTPGYTANIEIVIDSKFNCPTCKKVGIESPRILFEKGAYCIYDSSRFSESSKENSKIQKIIFDAIDRCDTVTLDTHFVENPWRYIDVWIWYLSTKDVTVGQLKMLERYYVISDKNFWDIRNRDMNSQMETLLAHPNDNVRDEALDILYYIRKAWREGKEYNVETCKWEIKSDK